MKKLTKFKFSQSKLTTSLTMGCLLFAVNISAQAESGASHHSGQASKHSALALSHTVAGSAKVASAVTAAPIIVAGGVSQAAGSVVLELGKGLSKASHASDSISSQQGDKALTITEITITADQAPNVAINKKPNTTTHKRTTKVTTTEVVNTETKSH